MKTLKVLPLLLFAFFYFTLKALPQYELEISVLFSVLILSSTSYYYYKSYKNNLIPKKKAKHYFVFFDFNCIDNIFICLVWWLSNDWVIKFYIMYLGIITHFDLIFYPLLFISGIFVSVYIATGVKNRRLPLFLIGVLGWFYVLFHFLEKIISKKPVKETNAWYHLFSIHN